MGSLTTAKKIPKDADVLVTIGDDVDFELLARLGRGQKGRCQQINLAAAGLRAHLNLDLDQRRIASGL